MKHLTTILFLFLIVVSGCGFTKIDQPKARSLVENLLNDLKNENYKEINQYYSSSFNESEPVENKIAKYNRLKEVTGPIESYELISATEKYDEDRNLNQLELKYKVKCKKITVEETFLIINDEGDLKIIFQNVENRK